MTPVSHWRYSVDWLVDRRRRGLRLRELHLNFGSFLLLGPGSSVSVGVQEEPHESEDEEGEHETDDGRD